MHTLRCLVIAGAAFFTVAVSASAAAPRGGPCDACDVNCDAMRTIADVDALVDVLVNGATPCSSCAGELFIDGEVNGLDIPPFVECLLTPQPTGACCLDSATCVETFESVCAGLWLGSDTTCQPGVCAFGNLTAYRPRHGAGYFPFTKSAVADVSEESGTLGPGIRINAPGDADTSGEDDLIEVLVQTTMPGVDVALRRGDAALRVWTTANKSPGTEIVFAGDRTGPLPLVGGSLTVYVEWAAAMHGEATLALEPLAAAYALDTLRFHTFHSIVAALGGEGQVPSVPVDTNHGTFVVGIALYNAGYDVIMHDEDDVNASGAGPVFNKVVDAIQNRQVDGVAIFGYSHGGGSTYDLAEKMDIERAGIGVFEIVVSSYVDSVGNNSDFDVAQELRRPPSTGYHANHYQVGGFGDFFLDGGPVPNSNPPPTGLNVETTPWGAGSDHFAVDDFLEVRQYIQTNFVSRLAR